MRARVLAPNVRGYALVATQLAPPVGAAEAPCRLAVLCERPLAPLAELPCARVERFEGARQRAGAARMVAWHACQGGGGGERVRRAGASA
jgi:hypothetical protein